MKKNYSTLEIVLKITNYIKKNQKKLLIYTTYNKWKNSYLEIERNKIMPLFPEEIHKNFPLHDDVLKLIIKELVNKIPFSKPYILKKYELNKDGIDYLLFPSSNPKKMVILFSGYSEHKTYNRYSWYWDESELWNQEVIYLFLNDLTKSWYVGTDEKPLKQSYIKIIQETINKFKLNRTQIYTIGGSMGGVCFTIICN